MKNKFFYFAALVLFVFSACMTFTSCSSDDDDDTFHISYVIVEVDSKACTHYGLSTPLTPKPGMMIRYEGNDWWENTYQSRIDGFTFEEGYYHRLKVRKKIFKADVTGVGPILELVMVIERRKQGTLLKSSTE